MSLELIDIAMDEEKWAAHPRVAVASRSELPESARVSPEALERRAFRQNKPFIPRGVHYNEVINVDTIRHFVDGLGDTNPLFRDEAYAAKTKYGCRIAPGVLLYTHQWAPMAGGFAGLHGWYSGGDWEWYAPLREGTKLTSVAMVRDLAVKPGRMAGGGNIYIDYGDVIYIDASSGEIVGKELFHTVWAERTAAGGAKKEFGKPKPSYSREDWLRILEMYDKEDVRGATPRHWEDVQVGDKLGPFIKGPLAIRDELAWLMGAGAPFFRAHKIEFDYELRHPKVLEYVEETGEADVPELVHFLDQFARGIGVERAYDYGNQRMSWLCNLFTNWIGDDGFLWKMSGDLRVFNMMGDLTIFQGEVVDKYVREGSCCVEVRAWAKNQRGETSMAPHVSTAILPSLQHGPVQYPKPSPKLVEEVHRARPLHEMIREGLI